MTLTCVIASYKYGHLAAHAIESVLSQTRKADEILFVDDGAGDCERLPKIYPQVSYVLRKENLGTVDNFQDMLMRVETDRCLFLGADNWLRQDAFEKLLLRSEDIVSYDIAITGPDRGRFVQRVGASEVRDGYEIWRFRQGDITLGNYIHGSSMYDTKKAQAVGYKPSGNSRTEEDWMLWRGMLGNGATHFHIPEPLLYYRRHFANFNGND